MGDPYRIDGPALVSFSGGRTSGFMLRRILDAHMGRLPSDVHVVFANAGKERDETLDFVRDCSERWGVPVAWVERHGQEVREVTHATASRKGEPFDALLARRRYLPNPTMRMCSQELKTRAMKRWMVARGYRRWTMVLGLRADEPRRVANMRRPTKNRWDVSMPMAVAGVALEDVLAFWASQPFDLRLRQWEGNCDLCFMKAQQKRARVMLDRPDLATWWAERETMYGDRFRRDEPGYAETLRIVQAQGRLFADEACAIDLGSCACHD